MPNLKRGMVAIFVAKLVFILAGYALYMSLSRLLTTEKFGIYGVVFGVVSLINMVLINGTWQTISHFVAANPGQEEAVRRRGFFYQTVFITLILGLFFISAPLLARFLNDASLSRYFRLSVMIMAIYAFYAINLGYLNGRHFFGRQASLDIGFALLKVSFIVLLVWHGLGIDGVIYGFTGAAFLILLISFFVSRFSFARNGDVDLEFKRFVRFALSVLGVALALNLVMNTDLFLLKKFSPQETANALAGYYTAAQSIARLPYYIMISASLVVFPMIAKLTPNDTATQSQRASTSSRALTMVLGALAGMVALCLPISESVVLVLYPDRLAPAASAFSILLIALSFLTLLNLAVSMISGSGHPGISAGILFSCFVIQVIAATVLVPSWGLKGAAVATLLGALASCFQALMWLHKNFRTRLSGRQFLSISVGFAITWGVSSLYAKYFLPAGRISTVLFLGVAYLGYLAYLFHQKIIVLRPLEPS